MRFTDFKNVLLIESDISSVNDLTAAKSISGLDSIIAASSQLPPEAQTIKSKITTNLIAVKDKIAASIQSLIASGQAVPKEPAVEPAPEEPVAEPQAQPTPQAPAAPQAQPALDEPTPEEEPVAEAIEGDIEYDALVASCEELKQQIGLIESMTMAAKPKAQLLATIKKSLDSNLSLLSKYSNVVDELKISNEKLKAAEDFIENVNDLLVTLGNKVQGYVEVSPEEYKALSAKARTAIDNARQFTTTFRQALFGMVLDISKQNQEIDKLSIQEFLTACVSGEVLDMLALTAVDRGNVRQHVKQEYQPMIDFFAAQKVFSWSPGKTSGAIGPGEMALCMMGSPTEKAKDKGDLIVGDTEFEIKAGSSSGGRLNSKKILKGPAAWPTWTAGIEKIVKKNAPKDAKWTRTDKTGKEQTVGAAKFSANTFNINKTTGKKKEAAAYNFNYRGLTKLNEEVLSHSTYELTYDLFYNTFAILITNLEEVRKTTNNASGQRVAGVSPEKLVSGAIYEDGTIDVDGMMAAYTRLAYESYNRADGVEAILFLNTSTLDYTIARNGKDLVGKLNGEITITGGFNFNDDQQSATPAYLARKA
jgi:hypothetical protein